jgi:hypothetical protein
MVGGGAYGEIRFLDSYNFMPMSLDKLPDAMSLPDHVKERGKGYFPHGFNLLVNYHADPSKKPKPEDY